MIGFRTLHIAGLCLALFACGGKQETDTGTSGIGTSHGSDPASDLDVDDPAAAADAGVPVPVEPESPYTFVLKNSHSEDLVLNMDRGWQPIIFAYSGVPPKAVSILMFPKHCTASCDAADGERCPVCPEPERVKDIKKAQKLETIKPGESLSVPWDGQVYSYEKTRDGRAKCECSTKAEPAANTYTVKACGLRLTQTADARSTFQCVESQMVLPGEGPQTIELDFGAPPAPKKKKRRR